MDSMDVHESWNFFHKQVTDCTEKHIPVIKNVGKRQKSKWMDEYCFRCVKDKYKAWNKYLHTKSRRHYIDYCVKCNRASRAIIHAKKKYKCSIGENIKENPKTFWSYVRTKTKSRTGIEDLKNKDGEIVSDDAGKANVLNDFFCFCVYSRKQY